MELQFFLIPLFPSRKGNMTIHGPLPHCPLFPQHRKQVTPVASAAEQGFRLGSHSELYHLGSCLDFSGTGAMDSVLSRVPKLQCCMQCLKHVCLAKAILTCRSYMCFIFSHNWFLSPFDYFSYLFLIVVNYLEGSPSISQYINFV